MGAGAGRREGILWLVIPGRVEEGHRRFWWRGEPLEPFLRLLQGPRVRPRAEREAVKTWEACTGRESLNNPGSR